MPRPPEIGNIQLYPKRPLRRSDRNGFVLKFYCPIRRVRIRKNCGTRDRREARRVLRECRERLLNGQYVASGGAITARQANVLMIPAPVFRDSAEVPASKSWQECYDRYREHQTVRSRDRSAIDSLSRLQIAERILEGYRQDHNLPEGLPMSECVTLDRLEYLQERLLAGDECRYDVRSPSTVNSMMGAVMAFVRFCHRHSWVKSIPAVQKLKVDDVMKGRPITGEEFERMLEMTPSVVGKVPAPSWKFALHILWESGFRVGDLMDFSWDDDRHIQPQWPLRAGHHPTIVVPSSQKNRRVQEIPMLPGLEVLLNSVPKHERSGWVVNPHPIEYEIAAGAEWFRPSNGELRKLAVKYSNRSIAAACGVSDTLVRKWLVEGDIHRRAEFRTDTGKMTLEEIELLRRSAQRSSSHAACRTTERVSKDLVSRIIGMIGEKAGIVVRQADERTGQRKKYASAHDLRRGCAQRLINSGISAETLKIVMRHRDFVTTEKFYGAIRSAQSAANELHTKLSAVAASDALTGGLVGGKEEAPQLNAEELQKLKRLLASF